MVTRMLFVRCLKYLILGFCLITKVSCLERSTHQPHIVLIIADDLGWNDVGFHGSNQIPTPNIDALAYNGIIFNRFYTAPICTPSRTALLTGQYSIRLGLQGIPITAGENRHIPFDVPTLPEKLQELGYKTHLLGKWHLGAAYKNVTPTYRGFHNHYGYWNGYVGYFDHEARGGDMTGLDMRNNFEPTWNRRGQYLTGVLTEEAENIIREHNESEPLFMMFAHLAPHTGNDGLDLDVPDIEENNKKFDYIPDDFRRLYAGMVDELDKSVGRVMKALAEKKILENSLVIFISDNGAQTTGYQRKYGSNWPLRGMKMTVLEGGVRNVAVMYSPLFNNTKYVNNELIHIADLMPSIYAAAGGNPEDLDKMDGVNQWPTILHNTTSKRSGLLLNIDEFKASGSYIGENGRYKLVNGSALYENYDSYYGEDGRGAVNPAYNTSAVLSSDANLAIGKDLSNEEILNLRSTADIGNCRKPSVDQEECTHDNLCLFNLFEDPCETTNVAKEFPDILEKLSDKLANLWKEVVPQKAKYIDPRANPIYFNNTWYTWLDEKVENVL